MLVLDTIRNIYLKDPCNYFILESQNLLLYSLDDKSIKIHNKANEIQVKHLNIIFLNKPSKIKILKLKYIFERSNFLKFLNLFHLI